MKHNGDINIELIEKRNSNKRTYVRLNCPSSSGQRSNHHEILESASSDDVMEHHTISKTPSVSQPLTYNSESFNQPDNYSTENTDESPKCMENANEDASTKSLSQPNPPNQLIQLLNKKPKRYQCTSCPYVSPCRSQLESHNKFHNQNECGTFQCRHCSYNVTKKHLLYQHQKMHEYEKVGREETNEDSSASEAIDLTSNLTKLDGHEKQLMFCSYCPARYLNEKELKGHLKMHASWFPYRCCICTYTSRQESYIETHMNVHSSSYQQKTKFMINEFDIKSDYPQPQLSSTPSDSADGNVSWIVSEFNQKQRLNVVPNHEGNDIDLDDMISSSKVPNKTFASPQKINVRDPACKPSTSIDRTVSPHKTILQAQGLQNRESKQNKIVISKPEKCPHCPFCTTKPDVLKEHMQCHLSVSGIENQKNCDHCDYSVSDELVLKEHVKLHFSPSSLSPTLILNRKSVAFFTCYDGLMLTSKNDDVDGNDARTIYPIAGDQELENVSDKENKKIIVDINTGEEVK